MVESKYSTSCEGIIKEAEENGELGNYIQRQIVDLNDVVLKLQGLDGFFERMIFLAAEYPGLYYLVCNKKKLTSNNYRQACQ